MEYSVIHPDLAFEALLARHVLVGGGNSQQVEVEGWGYNRRSWKVGREEGENGWVMTLRFLS